MIRARLNGSLSALQSGVGHQLPGAAAGLRRQGHDETGAKPIMDGARF